MLAELEGEKESGSEPEQVSSGYVSCVRVGGEPILPSVMTDQARLEALTWRRRALDVEERLAARRREKLAERIDDIVSKVKSSMNHREQEEILEENIVYSVNDYQEEESFNVYEVMRSNSRAADECLNNFHGEENRTVSQPALPRKSPSDKPETPSPKKSPRKSPRNESLAYDAKTAPKSFEEVKQQGFCRQMLSLTTTATW